MGTKTKDALMIRDGRVKKKQGRISKGKGQPHVSQYAPKIKGKDKGKGRKVKPNKARLRIDASSVMKSVTGDKTVVASQGGCNHLRYM